MRFADITRNMDVELVLFVIQPSSLVTKGLVTRTGDVFNAICTGESVEMSVELHTSSVMAKFSPALKADGKDEIDQPFGGLHTCVFVDQLSHPSSAMR